MEYQNEIADNKNETKKIFKIMEKKEGRKIENENSLKAIIILHFFRPWMVILRLFLVS